MPKPGLNIWGVLLKWVVIPIVFGCLGYFVIGPRIGSMALEIPDSQSSLSNSNFKFDEPEENVPDEVQFGEESATPSNQAPKRTPSRRSRT